MDKAAKPAPNSAKRRRQVTGMDTAMTQDRDQYAALRQIHRRGHPFAAKRDAFRVYEYARRQGYLVRYDYLRRDVFGWRPMTTCELMA